VIAQTPAWLASLDEAANNAIAYTLGNCTRFVAAALSWIPGGLGNAKDWLQNAEAKGLPVAPASSTPVPGSVAVWNTGQFGHVAEVLGAIPGGFQVAEENFVGLGQRDVRNVTGAALQGLEGFILPPNGLPVVGGLVSGAQAAAGLPAAIAGLPVTVGHGLADATVAGLHDVGAWFRNWLPALAVAVVVALILFPGGGDRS
jgi:hypothetical protein